MAKLENLVDRYNEAEEKVKRLQTRRDQLTGQMDEQAATLKKLGFDSVEAANAWLEKTSKQIIALNAKVEADISWLESALEGLEDL